MFFLFMRALLANCHLMRSASTQSSRDSYGFTNTGFTSGAPGIRKFTTVYVTGAPESFRAACGTFEARYTTDPGPTVFHSPLISTLAWPFLIISISSFGCLCG